MTTSIFDLVDGNPDIEQIDEWAENYFQTMLQLMNGFWSQVDINEVLKSLEAARFDQLVAEDLKEESPEVIATAMKLVNEKAQQQIEYLEAYLAKY